MSSVSVQVEQWIVDTLAFGVSQGEFVLPFTPSRVDRTNFSKQDLQTLRVMVLASAVERLRDTRGQVIHRVSVGIGVMKSVGLKADGGANPTSTFRLNEIDELRKLCDQIAAYYTTSDRIFFPDFAPNDLTVQPESQIDPVMDTERMAEGVFLSAVNIVCDVEVRV